MDMRQLLQGARSAAVQGGGDPWDPQMILSLLGSLGKIGGAVGMGMGGMAGGAAAAEGGAAAATPGAAGFTAPASMQGTFGAGPPGLGTPGVGGLPGASNFMVPAAMMSTFGRGPPGLGAPATPPGMGAPMGQAGMGGPMPPMPPGNLNSIYNWLPQAQRPDLYAMLFGNNYGVPPGVNNRRIG